MLDGKADIHFENLWGKFNADAWVALQQTMAAFDKIEASQIASEGYAARLGQVLDADLRRRGNALEETLFRVHEDFGEPLDLPSQKKLLALASNSLSNIYAGLEAYFARHLASYGVGPKYSSRLDLSYAGLQAGIANAIRQHFWTLRNVPAKRPTSTQGKAAQASAQEVAPGPRPTYLTLSFASTNGEPLGSITGELTNEEIAVLRGYVAQVDRLRQAELVKRGLPSITGMSFQDGGLKIECAEFENRDLHELLHLLRPLILEEERASFKKTLALMARRFRSEQFKKLRKDMQLVYDDGILSMYMQITVGAQPLFKNSLLSTWLNGTQYHTDADKSAAWDQLEAALTERHARAVVITQLHSRVDAIVVLAQVVEQALKLAPNVPAPAQ